jgi:hypothetical protein
MKKILLITLFSLLALTLFALEPYQEIAAGYYGDAGISMALRLEESARDIPFFLQMRGAYIYQTDPGNATDARSIFINDNSGGNIEKYGESYLAALDLGWKAKNFDKMSVEYTISGLWNYYMAHFTYTGDNESFTVKSASFGVGAGAALRIPLKNTSNSMIIKGGAEYFPKADLEAHGTYFYSPDGDDDTPRDDYTYDDADDAINQPRFRAFFQVGYLYRVGR